MNGTTRWSRTLVVGGLVGLLIGALDPLEGSVVILAGAGMVALEARLSHSRHRPLLYWSFVLVAIGVGAMVGLSAIGGFGGHTGRSNWWGLVMLPYPIGWVMGLLGAVRRLREGRRPSPAT